MSQTVTGPTYLEYNPVPVVVILNMVV